MIGVRAEGDLRVVADKLAEIPEVEYVVICAGSFDLLVEVVCEDDDHLLELLNTSIRSVRGHQSHRGVRISEAWPSSPTRGEPDEHHLATYEHLLRGDQMSTNSMESDGTETVTVDGGDPAMRAMQEKAKRHLWMHFSRMGAYKDHDIPVIVRGEGPYVWDHRGKRYLDGLAGLFTSQLGHGRMELAEAAGKQAGELAYFPIWTYAHPKAIELADKVASLAPGDLNRVFFTSGWLRGGRVRVEARQAVLQGDRPTCADQGREPQRRVPRDDDGGPVDHRRNSDQRGVRASSPGGDQGPEHELLQSSVLRRRLRGVRQVGGRRDRSGDRARRPRHGLRRVPRARAELRRLLRAASRILPTESARSATSTACCSSRTR